MIIDLLLIFSSISFFFFGIGCFISPKLVAEFNRYGIPQFRILTGILQIVGAAGIFAGYAYAPLQWLSTGGLSLLMLCGVGIRIKIKDGFWQTLPALLYCGLNAVLCLRLLS